MRELQLTMMTGDEFDEYKFNVRKAEEFRMCNEEVPDSRALRSEGQSSTV
jgi:hypothetical protein